MVAGCPVVFHGFMDYNFMPYAYILLVILYWTAGYYNRLILRKVFA